MKKIIVLLFYLTLLPFVKGLAEDRYARQLNFDLYTKDQNIFKDQGGKKTLLFIQNDIKVLLVDGTWVETLNKISGDLLFDGYTLSTDAKEKSTRISDFAKAEKLADHDTIAVTLTYRKTDKKYNPNSVGLPSIFKDRILESRDSLILHFDTNDILDFHIVINDTTLIVDESFVTNKDITFSPSSFGLDSILSGIHENKIVSIKRIRVHTASHIPSFIKNIKCEYSVEEVPYLEDPSWYSKLWTYIKENLWILIVAGVILASIIVGLVLFILQRRKKRKGEEPLDFPNGESDEKGPEIEPVSPEVEIQNLKDEIARMARDLSQERNNSLFYQGQANKVFSDYKLLETSVQSQIEKATKSLRDNLDSVKKELKNLKDETKQKIEEARSDEKEKQKQKIDDLTNKVKTLNENLEQEKKDKKKQVEDARKEEKEKSEKTISELNTKLDTLRNNLTETQNCLRETELALNQKTADFNRDEQTIAILNEAQRQYTERITFVDFAHQYASNVQRLLDIVAKINVSASKLIEANVPDPYLIYKAISRFSLAQSEINFENLATEVNMAASCKMTFSNNGIANLSGVAPAEQINSLRNYFLAAYLEKYINAVMVYNESLAGIDRLVKGLTPQLTAPFVQYREELKACFKQLGIAVISVKLFDSLGDNMDLKAKIIDYDDSLPSESIIEIQNCLVYPEGGRRPNDKIFVTAQR